VRGIASCPCEPSSRRGYLRARSSARTRGIRRDASTSHRPHDPIAWLGLFLTAAAISLGAPFWFDLLNKLMVVRARVKPKEKSADEGSEDRKPQAFLA
jgi:hypothetical protein